MNIRKLTIQAIEKIIYKGGYSNIVINEYLTKFELNEDERRFFTKIVLGTVEKRLTLDYFLKPFVHKKQKPWLHAILLMSVYQLVYMEVPEYAVVNEAVDLANLNDRNVGSFVNGVLRNFLRTPLRSFDGLDEIMRLSYEYSYPSWLVAYLLKDYDYQTILKLFQYNDSTKKDAIRINRLKTTIEEVKAILIEDKIPFFTTELVKDGLIVNQPMMNHQLFTSGKITIQDLASQLVVEVANLKEHSLVIDLCSAPGGKAAHMASIMNNTGKIYACDIHPHKIKLMDKNFKRLGVTNITTQLIDACEVSKVVKSEVFDFVFADLPCSGLGVMSHKADLKYNITLEAITEIIKLQKNILESAYHLIKKNGFLIVSTCTINKSENEEQIAWLQENHPDLVVDYQKMIFPFENDTDGFFICKLQKVNKND